MDKIMEKRFENLIPILILVVYIGKAFSQVDILRNGHIMGIDFSLFYAASKLTLLGHSELVYNLAAHHQVIEALHNTKIVMAYPYFYPPTSLFMFLPLALIPHDYARVIWLLFSLAIYAFAAYKLFPDKMLFVLGFPGVGLTLYWCQNSFITVGLMLGFIYFLQKKPWLAGVLLGLLTYKPQFAAFCLIAVLADRNWKCVAGSAITTLSLIAASFVFFGMETWKTFLGAIKARVKGRFYDSLHSLNYISTNTQYLRYLTHR
jgi:alpha-1,2-mannosyltransferase